MQGYSFRDKVKATHKRRAIAVAAPGSFDKYDVLARLGKQGHLCHYCKVPLFFSGRNKYQVEHFVPLSRGGSNWATNIVIACPECNRRKASAMPHEFMPERFKEGGGRDA